MSNFFDAVANKFKSSPFVIWIHILSWLMLAVGVLHFYEDTLSSLNGIQQLENVFGIKPVNLNIIYWTLSISPQLAQMVFFYGFLIYKKQWSLGVAAWFFLMDFAADVQDRSAGHLFAMDDTINLDIKTLVAAGFTLNFYTIGSELFISFGIGLILATFMHAIIQYAEMTTSIRKALREAKDKLRRSNQPDRPPQPVPARPPMREPR